MAADSLHSFIRKPRYEKLVSHSVYVHYVVKQFVA